MELKIQEGYEFPKTFDEGSLTNKKEIHETNNTEFFDRFKTWEQLQRPWSGKW